MADSVLDSILWEWWGKKERLRLADAAWVIWDMAPPPRREKRPIPKHVEDTEDALFFNLKPVVSEFLFTVPFCPEPGPDGLTIRGRDYINKTWRRNVRDYATRDEFIAWCKKHDRKPAAWFPESRPGQDSAPRALIEGDSPSEGDSILWTICQEVKRKYWLDQTDEAIEHGPSRDAVIAELQEDYGLSQREAEHVDTVTRPDKRRNKYRQNRKR